MGFRNYLRLNRPANEAIALGMLFLNCAVFAVDDARHQPAAGSADLDAQERALRAERAQIDQKLEAIAQQRRRQTPTTGPAASPATGQMTGQGDGVTSPEPAGKEGTANAPSPAAAPAATTNEPAWFNVHGQATVITQKHDAFHAPYAGGRSLERGEPTRTSVSATLYFGLRMPWAGGQLYFDPEVSGGEGFSGVSGIAGFPNGDIPRVGEITPQPYVARLFYRQSFGFGGKQEQVLDGPNQLAESRDASRLTILFGKFGADDYFQQSVYANDPRGQFMNWGLYTAGAWDYSADPRGYTQGAIIELNAPDWALRYGAMTEPKTTTSTSYDSRLLQALAQSLEYERRWIIDKHPGAAKVMGFVNRSRSGKFREAIDDARAGTVPDIASTRSYRDKYGFAAVVDQELMEQVGAFVRVGWNDGHSEDYSFTEIDRSLAVGLSVHGGRWHRPDDVIGLAGTINWLAKDHRDYLGAGGLGTMIGDGRLEHYAPEEIVEIYYLAKIADHVLVTPDFQLVNHPAYNHDRGPVLIGGIRAHIEF